MGSVGGVGDRDENEKAELAEGDHLLVDKYGLPLFNI